jgi:hypothetical protein
VRLDDVIRSVLAAQYTGGFDAVHACWRFRYQLPEGDSDYCMRPLKHAVIDTPTGQRLFLIAASAADIRDDSRYLYSSDAPGLLGAFELALTARGPQLLSSAKALEYGTAGACGCDAARLERIGQDRYAWVFTSGGTWQGVTAASYAIVTARDGEMVDVSRLPFVTESDQNSTYELTVDHSAPALAWYPVSLTKRTSGERGDQRTIAFDHGTGAYSMPEGF